MLYLQVDYGSNPPKDNGTRPYGGTTPLWDNASIWMTGGPGVTQTSTHVGDATDIRVRVTNSGPSAVDFVQVDAYLMNPFVGATYPAQAIATFGGTITEVSPGSGGPSPTDPHVALCQLPTTPPQSWVPTTQEIANTTPPGHMCLLANVYAAGVDGRALGSGDPFDVANNPHHGQRNIIVLASTKKAQIIKIEVMPPLLAGHPTLLDIHALTSKNTIGMGENWLLRSQANVVRTAHDGRSPWYYLTGSHGKPDTALTFSRKQVAGTIDLPDIGAVDLRAAARATKAAVARTGGAEAVAFRRDEDGARIRVEPTREILTATLTLARDDVRGSLQAFDIVQRTEDGRVTGGLRLLSLVTGELR
jgi:hypothetical protein